MRPYDWGFRPPAPVLSVTVAHPIRDSLEASLAARLDTGAGITVIPGWLVTRLQLRAQGRTRARGFDGRSSMRLIYYPRFVVEGYSLPAIRCVASERNDVLLGRNVLN